MSDVFIKSFHLQQKHNIHLSSLQQELSVAVIVQLKTAQISTPFIDNLYYHGKNATKMQRIFLRRIFIAFIVIRTLFLSKKINYFIKSSFQ